MVSDIKSTDPRQIPGTRTGEAGSVRNSTRTGTGSANATGARDDTVQLSGMADLVRAAARRMASGAPVDEARVQEIRQAITEGNYQLDPARIARKLIETDSRS